MINWSISPKEAELILKIAHRATDAAHAQDIDYPVRDANMDITAAHNNGNPLRLSELLAADPVHFNHDVFGIRRFLDRSTGELTGNFTPRHSA